MRIWDQVYSVENIKFTANDGQDKATIYGNQRNCVALTVYFNGRDKKGNFVDLSGEKFDFKDVQLINQGNGNELPRNFGDEEGNGLIYSDKSNKFGLKSIQVSPAFPQASPEMAKRAKVTFYIYGEAEAELEMTIGARFIFYDTSKLEPYDTTQDNRTSQFVRITVLPEIRYGLNDIEPVKWEKSADFHDFAVQWDLYIKLKDQNLRGNKWVHSELEKTDLNNPMFAEQQGDTCGYYYFVWPIGPENEKNLNNGANNFWIKVRYNKVHGALNLVMIRGWLGIKDLKPDLIIKLYDVHGNMGKYRVDWLNYLGDNTKPSIAEAN